MLKDHRGSGCLPPTLEGQDVSGDEAPGLVDIAEKLVVVGLWVRKGLHPPLAPSQFPSTNPLGGQRLI